MYNIAMDLVEIGSEPLVHPVVDDGVDTGVGHGQPVEGEIDVANVGVGSNVRVVVGVDEVDVVGGPAHHEDPHHHCEHLHQLRHTQLVLVAGVHREGQMEGSLIWGANVKIYLCSALYSMA